MRDERAETRNQGRERATSLTPRHSPLTALAICLFSLVPTLSHSQTPEPLPSPDVFLRYTVGERFTPHAKIQGYFEELARKSDLITLEEYGESYEGRPLFHALITSRASRESLPAIRQSLARLSDPRGTTQAAATELARTAPLVIWFGYGVHGDEASSPEAAMRVAHWLTGPSEEAIRIRENAIVIIDPMQNPDGHEQYIQSYVRRRGRAPNDAPESLEHAEFWPSGRQNHYMVDLNRDWAWGSQQESRARIAAYRNWNPHLFVDFHEMNYESSYFFPPDASPINANIGRDITRWLEVFGRANAEEFSRRGWPFFVGERFDLFYPGYGDSWPSLRGAIGMTYEVGGGRYAGVAVKRQDGSVVTLGSRLERHVATSLATLLTAVKHREELLLYTFRTLQQGVADPHSYVLLNDSANFVKAIETLRLQGIEVKLTAQLSKIRLAPIGSATSQLREIPAGSAVVAVAQPLGALARSLLERTPALPPEFLEQQRNRVDADESDEFYDVTTWSLPVTHDLRAFETKFPITTPLVDWVEPAVAKETVAAAKFGYLVDIEQRGAWKFAGALLTAGLNFSVATSDLRHDGALFRRGSLLIQNLSNQGELRERLTRLSIESGGIVLTPVDNVWSGTTALGSHKLQAVRAPKIAVAAGKSIDATSLGSVWFALDVETGIPHTLLPVEELPGLDLSGYRVLVLPSGDVYEELYDEKELGRLESWIRSGGTLIVIGKAAKFLREKGVELSKAIPWTAAKKPDQTTLEERYNDFRIPGSAFRGTMNRSSYLTMGMRETPPLFVQGTEALLPVAHRVDNIVTIDAKDPLLSGFAWPESIERIKGSAWLVAEPLGEGRVITFTNEPFFRNQWRGTLPFFLNAVLYSPSIKPD